MKEHLNNLVRLLVLGLILCVFAGPIAALGLWVGFGWAIVAALIVFVVAYRLTPTSMEGGLTLLLIGIALAIGVVIAMAADIGARLT